LHRDIQELYFALTNPSPSNKAAYQHTNILINQQMKSKNILNIKQYFRKLKTQQISDLDETDHSILEWATDLESDESNSEYNGSGDGNNDTSEEYKNEYTYNDTSEEYKNEYTYNDSYKQKAKKQMAQKQSQKYTKEYKSESIVVKVPQKKYNNEDTYIYGRKIAESFYYLPDILECAEKYGLYFGIKHHKINKKYSSNIGKYTLYRKAYRQHINLQFSEKNHPDFKYEIFLNGFDDYILSVFFKTYQKYYDIGYNQKKYTFIYSTYLNPSVKFVQTTGYAPTLSSGLLKPIQEKADIEKQLNKTFS
jgi:hypothetical protein